MQAGNNKNNDNIVGYYTITRSGNAFYVTYELINEGSNINNAHLSVKTAASFTGSPGTDDNQNYGEWFTVDGAGDTIYVFAHWEINH